MAAITSAVVQPARQVRARYPSSSSMTRRLALLSSWAGQMAPIQPPEGDKPDGEQENYDRFGLMGSFVQRWTTRLPLALALGAGEHVKLPSGNSQLIDILEPFDQ